jgi:integrase
VSRQISGFFRALDMEWTAHNLRHWFGTEVYAACRDLRVTQEMMGHANPTTTAGYTAWSPEVADGVVRGLSLGDDPDPPVAA